MKRKVGCEAQISVKYVRHGKAVFCYYRCSRHRTYEALQKYFSSKEDFRFAIVYKFRKGQRAYQVGYFDRNKIQIN